MRLLIWCRFLQGDNYLKSKEGVSSFSALFKTLRCKSVPLSFPPSLDRDINALWFLGNMSKCVFLLFLFYSLRVREKNSGASEGLVRGW